MAKTISRMQNRVRNIMLSDFRLQYKVTVAKTIWYWQKKTDTQVDGIYEQRDQN